MLPLLFYITNKKADTLRKKAEISFEISAFYCYLACNTRLLVSLFVYLIIKEAFKGATV